MQPTQWYNLPQMAWASCDGDNSTGAYSS